MFAAEAGLPGSRTGHAGFVLEAKGAGTGGSQTTFWTTRPIGPPARTQIPSFKTPGPLRTPRFRVRNGFGSDGKPSPRPPLPSTEMGILGVGVPWGQIWVLFYSLAPVVVVPPAPTGPDWRVPWTLGLTATGYREKKIYSGGTAQEFI